MIPYTTIPFLSALFLVAVGVLMGHLIWYRHRDQQEHLAQHLQGKNRALKDSLTQHHDVAERMSAAYESAAIELTETRSALEAAQLLADGHERAHRDVLMQFEQEQQARRDLQACLEDERQHHLQTTTERQALQQTWQQLQREHDAAQEHVRCLTEQLDALTSRLQQQDDSGLERRGQLAVLESQCHQYQHAAEILAQQATQLQQQISQRESDNERLAEALAVATTQLQTWESQARVDHDQTLRLTDRLAAAETACQQRDHQIARLTEQHQLAQSALLAARQQLAAQSVELSNREAEREAESNAAREAERNEWTAQRERERAEAELRLAAAAEEVNHLRNQLESATAQLNELSGRELRGRDLLAGMNRDLQLARDEQQRLHVERDGLAARLLAASAELAAGQELRATLTDLEVVVQLRDRKIRDMEAELQQQTNSMSSLLGEVESLRDQLDDFEAERLQWSAQVDVAQVANDQLQHGLDVQRRRCDTLEEALAASREKVTGLRRDLERLETIEDQFVELDAEFRQARDELKQLRKQRDQALESEAATRQSVVELREELSDRLDAVAALRRDKEASQGQLEFERRQRQQAQEALDQAEQRLAGLRSEVDALAQRQAKLSLHNSELEQQLTDSHLVARELEQRLLAVERDRQELVAQVETRQRSSRRDFRSLVKPSEREAVTDPRAGLSFRGMLMRERSWRDEDDAKMIRHPALGSLYDEAPRRRDDLQQIPGIVASVEERLNQLGVYAYRQIMEWNETIACEFAARLELDDTIRAQDWIGPARQLYHQAERAAA